MRRVLGIALLLAAAGSLCALLLGTSAQGSSTSQIDVIFDDAKGLVGGQVLKVAGAQAGTIENVVLTKDYKARIEMSIDSRFMPFRQDATCTILAEGLISENYVNCNPGSASSPALRASGGFPPTVPVSHTTEPVNLLDLFNIFNQPTRERFTLLVNELGIGTAGEGQNINDIILRANPALAAARQVIGILGRQRAQLATIVDATNTVAASLSRNTPGLQGFLDNAATLTRITAAHRSNLALAINRLPGLLAQAQPSLQELNTVAVDGTPLVQQIHASVPALNRVATDLGPFVAAAKPGLAKLGATLTKATPAVRDATPLIKVVRNYTQASLPSTKLTGKLFTNLQQHGFIESFLSMFYYLAAATSRFDATSHMLGFALLAPGGGACATFASSPVAGCSSNFGGAPATLPSSAARPATQTGANGRPGASSTSPSPSAPSGSAAPTPSGAPTKQSAPTTTTAPPSTASGGSAQPPSAGSGQGSLTLQGLLDYLIK
jgi:virulence factor Mce-like protein